jgi:hypothetical protein
METPAEFFNKHGYSYIKNVLSDQQCNDFTKLLLDMKHAEQLVYEGGNAAFYDNSYGGNHPEFEAALRELTPRLEHELGVKMTPANSFARIYYNGGTLHRHTDRDGLNYTLSITLDNTLDTEWPLWCIDKLGNEVPINIERGDGGMMLGTQMTHWRNDLVCAENQHLCQLFMHWSFPK